MYLLAMPATIEKPGLYTSAFPRRLYQLAANPKFLDQVQVALAVALCDVTQ